MTKITLFVLLILTSPAGAEINWYQVSANTLLTADWLQTRNIAKDDDYFETNGILGEQPTVSEVNQYFAISLLLTNGIGYLLPEDIQDHFYLSVAVVEGAVVLNNYRIGIRFEF